jgi:hypothetical protein
MHKNRQPAVPCCECCGDPLLTDDFADGDYSANWTADAGTWTEAGGMISTSSANALLRLKTTKSGNQNVRVWMDIVITDYFQAFEVVGRIYVKYADAANCLYVQLRTTNSTPYYSEVSTLTMHQVLGGVDTTLATVTDIRGTTSSGYLFEICYRNGRLAVTGGSGLTPGQPNYFVAWAMLSGDYSSLGDSVLLGTTTISKPLTTSVKFDNFSLLPSDTSCPNCRCSVCRADTTISSIQVEISGVVAGGTAGCTCTDWNGTWVLAQVPTVQGGYYCGFKKTTGVPACPGAEFFKYDGIDAWVSRELMDDPAIWVHVAIQASGGNAAIFSAVIDPSPVCEQTDCCANLQGVKLDYEAGSDIDPYCDWTGATITVTATCDEDV